MPNFIDALVTSALWFVLGLLPILVIVTIQNIISRYVIPMALQGRIARKGFYSTAVIGVPIHELSHAIMAFLFGHRVVHICFFDFSPTHGRLGYVSHEWNPLSLRHTIGLFFIGIAPLFGVGCVVWGASLLLIPGSLDAITAVLLDARIDETGDILSDTLNAVWLGVDKSILAIRIAGDAPLFPIWLLLTSAVALHATPSRADLASAIRGAAIISIVLSVMMAIAGHFFPVGEWAMRYWILGISIMAVVIGLSTPWWVLLLGLCLIDKSFNTSQTHSRRRLGE